MESPKIENGSFMLNGTRWFVHTDLQVGRLASLEKHMFSFLHGLEPDEFGRILRRVYDDLNNTKFADAAVKMYNLINATEVKKVGAINPKLQIAMLFINKEGENLSEWSDEMARLKLDEWAQYPAGFFFQQADGLISDTLKQIYGIPAELAEMMTDVGSQIHRTDSHATKQVQDLTMRSGNKSQKDI